MDRNQTQPARVVIVGGGFAGVYTALWLERIWMGDRRIEVTLISRNNYYLMTPLLFEASSGVLEPRHAVNPIRPLLRHTRFIEAEVEAIDLERQIVATRPESDEQLNISFDHIVLALGGITNRSFIRGSEKALTFKTMGDAIFLRNHAIQLFERAEVEQDPSRKTALLTFIIVGAGLVGVELMGEMTEFLHNVRKSYPSVTYKELKFELIDSGPRIMQELDEDLAQYAANVLRRRGVNIRLNTRVGSIEGDRLQLEDGQLLTSETIIVATGVAPSPLVAALPIEKDKRGRAVVEPTLRSRQHPNLWALGDCSTVPDPQGKPYPPLAQHALRQAKVLAGNITSALRGGPLKPFDYKSLGTLAALGHYQGVGRVMGLKIRGVLAWWVWRSYYLMQMPRWSRRIRIILDWTVALLFRNDVVQLDLFGDEHPAQRSRKQNQKASA
ncbi:MAG: NAD(P)/FAD-dependent oxidoreductase [Phycisphaerales bacterium]|jgi:NADH dehydrogenase|nr:NAD(P)/FAD-dependent oxidoreductase [Phycisphaerales bacterium]